MPRTPKRLAGPALVSNAAADKYTAPAGGAIVRHIHVANPTASPVDFTLSIGADAAGTRVFDGHPIPADSELDHYCYYPLGNAEKIQAFAGTNNVAILTIGGDEIS